MDPELRTALKRLLIEWDQASEFAASFAHGYDSDLYEGQRVAYGQCARDLNQVFLAAFGEDVLQEI